MDDRRFDAIARSLGTARSRRGALGLLAGAAGLGLAGADAKRRHKGKKGKQAKPATVSAACAAAGSKACTLAQAKPGAVLKDCDYAAADLSGKALNATNLSKASLAGANLSGANLAGANLASACLSGADLSGANLRGTSLSGADLTGANICGADLRGSNVKPAQLATATPCCPDGHEVVNGGCFWIVNDESLWGPCVNAGCSVFGSIVGSPNYLCGKRQSATCSETANCPAGQACQTRMSACVAPCPVLS